MRFVIWGESSDMAAAENLIEKMLGGVSFPGAELKGAIQREKNIIDYQMGYSFVPPDDGWTHESNTHTEGANVLVKMDSWIQQEQDVGVAVIFVVFPEINLARAKLTDMLLPFLRTPLPQKVMTGLSLGISSTNRSSFPRAM